MLLTGATGYVGGRLLRKLEQSGRPVRCMARRPEALLGRVADHTEVVGGDILEPSTLRAALAGVATAYYLVHSMAASAPFAQADRRGAENFAAATREGGVRRIVYLGGLGADEKLSTHLARRHKVAGSCASRASRRRVSRLDHHRIGKFVLRDRARPRRPLPGPAHAALGRLTNPADRH